MDYVIDAIKKIAMEFSNINRIVLFGSRARGDNTDKSDYDIAIFESMLNNQDKNELLNKIEEIDTLLKIDVVFVNQDTNLSLIQNIKKDGIIILDKFIIKLENYQKALSRLHETIEEFKNNSSLSIRDGAIQRFEFTTELSWKTIREYLLTLEVTNINNPRTVLSEAFQNNIIDNEDGWIQILRDRNSTSHIYDESEANEIYERISEAHVKLFDILLNKLTSLRTF